MLRLPGDASFWFSFNHAHPLLRDVRVRQAIYHAVDRDQMVRTLLRAWARREQPRPSEPVAAQPGPGGVCL